MDKLQKVYKTTIEGKGEIYVSASFLGSVFIDDIKNAPYLITKEQLERFIFNASYEAYEDDNEPEPAKELADSYTAEILKQLGVE